MKTYYECIPCFLNQTVGAVQKVTNDAEIIDKVTRGVLRLVSYMDMTKSPPVMGQEIHRMIRKMTGRYDPYKKEKSEYNKLVISLLPEIEKKISNSGNLFVDLVRLTIAGNIIDFGQNSGLKKAEVMKSIENSMNVPIDDTAVKDLQNSILNAEKILYLGDNCGEIVFDRLFIERVCKDKVTYAVRGNPIINDVTTEDAYEAGLKGMVEIVDNGSDAPGTVLSDCSKDFLKLFDTADLIISKGQGNYETLNDVDKNIVFLFQVKCEVVARDTGYPMGSFVVKRNRDGR